jgi:hypothetical protein
VKTRAIWLRVTNADADLRVGGVFVVMLLVASCGGGSTKPIMISHEPPPRTVTVTRTVTMASPARRQHAAEQTPVSALDPGARASFAALQRHLSADERISVAVQPLGAGRMTVLGGDPQMLGMSTTKILVLAALLRDRGGVAALTTAQQGLARAAVTESDNQAILALFAALEQDRGGLTGASNYATALLREAGDPSTTVATASPPSGYATTFGQTAWSPSDEVRFFRFLALGCLLPPRDTRYILRLMSQIEPSESWGLGAVGFGSVAFKGGWGPLPNGQYGVRQTGIIGQGDQAVVIAITDQASSFAGGTSLLTDVAHWLRSQTHLTPHAGESCAAARSP